MARIYANENFSPRLVFPLPNTPAVRGVFTARPGGVRGNFASLGPPAGKLPSEMMGGEALPVCGLTPIIAPAEPPYPQFPVRKHLG